MLKINKERDNYWNKRFEENLPRIFGANYIKKVIVIIKKLAYDAFYRKKILTTFKCML